MIGSTVSKKATARRIFSALALGMLLPMCTENAGQEESGTEPADLLAGPGERQTLRDGWAIRSSKEVTQDGAALSTVGFDSSAWLQATLPSTVVAARIARGDFPDPNFGMNMRNIPGTTDYPIGENFSLFEMKDTNPYKVPWWYRTEFEVASTGGRTWLHFDGINYRANIWLNGKKIASETDIAGSYRRYNLDVTGIVKPGQRNALAVQVFAPRKNDLAPSFIDWNPQPADKNLGIWHDVYLTTTGSVKIEHPFVVSKVPNTRQASLTVNAELSNATNAAISGTVKVTIDGNIQFSEPVTLAAKESKALSITPDKHRELVIDSPKLWWPYQLGEQNLHDLKLEFVAEGTVSDVSTSRFGIREVKMDMIDGGKWSQYKVNGTPLLIRGAGYTSNFMFRFDDKRDEQEMQLVKDMGLNTIRIEGKMANDHLLEVTDREGILVMTGWECCSVWEYWQDEGHDLSWTPESHVIAQESLRSQLLRLRGRPSLLTFLYGSDSHPPADIEKEYLSVVAQARWPLPAQNQASERDPSTVTGHSGFKMPGPYDYVPPVYWYADKKYGGAWGGFNSETGPGPAVPNVDSLKKFLPADKLWPINSVWDYHMGGGRFANLDIHTKALEARYGKANNVENYALKSQAIAYDGERAEFESYRRNKGKATGIVAWMLNNAWPSMLWHLYDYYLAAGGGYYGTKKANEPIHIQYSYDNRTVVVANDSAAPVSGLKATAEVYDLKLKKLFSDQKTGLTVSTDKSVVALTIPALSNLTSTYFVRLVLRDAQDKVVGHNFYWLSTKADKFDWDKSDWWGTPVTQHADLTGVNSLPKAAPALTATAEGTGAQRKVRVTVQNDNKTLAFLLRLKVTKGKGGDEVLPSTWSDNYISLLPGEKREVVAEFAASDIGNAKPTVVLTGWNVAETTAQP
ncbi:glycosyl hydrolase 2 galactose-binding domain-containing protein [Pendulispora albinea]|uniref:Exo-1,4-beta-D-glucosaminidase n=1 Tax=Pendulispora albinea TaxID=2741071 RepID=A0ABZ2M0Y0_9BACT